MKRFVFNDCNVCTNPNVLKKTDGLRNFAEVRTAQHGEKWSVGTSFWCGLHGGSSPACKDSCIYNSETEARLHGINNLMARIKNDGPANKMLLKMLATLKAELAQPSLFSFEES